jgi:hypothetical protein
MKPHCLQSNRDSYMVCIARDFVIYYMGPTPSNGALEALEALERHIYRPTLSPTNSGARGGRAAYRLSPFKLGR